MDVSVIIPALNAEKTIARAIGSALNQTLGDIEVIVVDDGSEDRTRAIVSEIVFGDARVHLITHDIRQGVSAARNAAIEAAEGEWIAMLDSDDWFGPQRLQRLIDHARFHRLDGVVDNLLMVDALTGEHLGEAFPRAWLDPAHPMPTALPVSRDIPYHQDGMGFGYCKPIFNRAAFLQTVGGYDRRFKCGEDLLALQKFLFHGAKVGAIEKAHYFYSVDLNSHSNKPGANVHISNVNRALTIEARKADLMTILPLLQGRQIIIDFDALTKALKSKRTMEAFTFLKRVPLTVLAAQVLRIAVRKFGYDLSRFNPRNRKWLQSKTSLHLTAFP